MQKIAVYMTFYDMKMAPDSADAEATVRKFVMKDKETFG